MSTKQRIDNKIDIKELWKGIGGHFDSLNQIIHEIIDNSISNFRANPELNHHTILLKINQLNSKEVKIIIEDTGTGIKNINNAFTIGSKKSQESPLNEHGFGLKHALATANPNNDKWKVFTRTQENIENNNVLKVESPYMIEDFYGSLVEFSLDNYPTSLANYSTGTIVEFTTSYEMYKTLGKYGTQDSLGIALYLKEDLGFIYSGVIKSNIAQIQIIVNDEQKIIVNAIEPWVEKTIEPGEGREKVDLGLQAFDEPTGYITLDYKFLYIRERTPSNDNEKVVYYKPNMKSSGVEIRINGRLIKNNILNEIWPNHYQHNRFNNFLVQINLESDKLSSLPTTRSSKNGFKQGDIKLAGLFNWIRKHCSVPFENKNERESYHLFEELKNIKKQQLGDIFNLFTIDLNKKVFKNYKENLSIDMFMTYDNSTFIYKGIKEVSSINDLYMLKFFWDASVIEGTPPTTAILLATEHSQLVQDLASMNNDLKDISGRNYKFILKKWKDENIDFPKKEK